MIEILSFNKSHIQKAKELIITNYNEERSFVTTLPQIQIDTIPDKAFYDFIENGLGVVMFDDNKILGFLCCDNPYDNAFGSTARGIFVPLHAHGAIPENRDIIYKKLYQSVAKIWVDRGIAYHAICLYAHDTQTKEAFFDCGFGSRCVDAIRPLTNFEYSICEGVTFRELADSDLIKVRDLRNMLVTHLGESPCFMRSSEEEAKSWITRAESRDSRLFFAMHSGRLIAFIEVTDDGENFATWEDSIQNICGAFCLPEFRGKGIMQGLLNYVITLLKTDKTSSLGVDFESFNLLSNGFWLKHFTAYTYSVTRRIDECAINKN